MAANHLLQRVIQDGDALPFDDARALMTSLLGGDFSEGEMAALLTALRHRGETAEELAGFRDAMQASATRVPLSKEERSAVVDSCGTGGDGSGTFNISTAVALTAAAAGAKVAKHGNRAVTSRCGSADVLDALRIRTDHNPESAAADLREYGFAFLLATRMHPAMKAVAPVRRSLPFRTVFNLLGPMTNPAGARRQVLGVYSPEAVPLVAGALAFRGDMEHALVVHGDGGLDELSLSGESIVAEVRGSEVRQFALTPEDAGLVRSNDALGGGNAEENAAILQAIFAGQRSPSRDVVLLNAAALLWVAGIASSLRDGAEMASSVIDRGAVQTLVEALRSSRSHQGVFPRP